MNKATLSALNALLLISLGLMAYFSSATPSNTALIPVFIGLPILACNKGIRSSNRMITALAILLSLLILAGLIMPLKGAIARADSMAITRVILMQASTVVALIALFKKQPQLQKAQSTQAR